MLNCVCLCVSKGHREEAPHFLIVYTFLKNLRGLLTAATFCGIEGRLDDCLNIPAFGASPYTHKQHFLAFFQYQVWLFEGYTCTRPFHYLLAVHSPG